LLALDARSERIEERVPVGARAISVVSLGEMHLGAIRAHWGQRRVAALDDHLHGYVILPIDIPIADEWARLGARCLDRGLAKEDNDIWIAATARRHGLTLATLDHDQYDMPGLKVIKDDGTEVAVPE
jgi:predicted nucleic acid-binding protein